MSNELLNVRGERGEVSNLRADPGWYGPGFVEILLYRREAVDAIGLNVATAEANTTGVEWLRRSAEYIPVAEDNREAIESFAAVIKRDGEATTPFEWWHLPGGRGGSCLHT